MKKEYIVAITYIFGVIFTSLYLFLFNADAGINKDIYTKTNAEIQKVHQQYEADKKYLSNLIITYLCKENGFSATQIVVIQMNKNPEVLKDIANEVLGIGTKKFIKEVNTALNICDKKLTKIKDNTIEDIIVSYSIKYKVTVKQIIEVIRVHGIII